MSNSSDDKMDRFETKLDKVIDKIGYIDVTLAAQHVTLEEHMRRTAALEAQIDPLKEAHSRFTGILKLFPYICAVAAGVESLLIIIRGLK